MSDHSTSFLPDGWEEAYYEAESDGTYTNIKAIYEHVETGSKVTIVPNCTLAQAAEMGHTDHEVTLLYPLYSDCGTPHPYTLHFSNVLDTLTAVVPEVKHYSEEDETVNEGPYKMWTNSNGPEHILSALRQVEAEYDWSTFPDEEISSLKTFKQYPLDYRPMIENAHYLNEFRFIHREEPELVDRIQDVDIILSYSEDASKWYYRTEPVVESSLKEELFEALDNPETLEGVEKGTIVGTARIDIDTDDFPYMEIVGADYTDRWDDKTSSEASPSFVRRLRTFIGV